MKRSELERYLKDKGCLLRMHGHKHDIWENAEEGTQSTIPRHAELKTGTALAICKQLKVPKPPFR